MAGNDVIRRVVQVFAVLLDFAVRRKADFEDDVFNAAVLRNHGETIHALLAARDGVFVVIFGFLGFIRAAQAEPFIRQFHARNHGERIKFGGHVLFRRKLFARKLTRHVFFNAEMRRHRPFCVMRRAAEKHAVVIGHISFAGREVHAEAAHIRRIPAHLVGLAIIIRAAGNAVAPIEDIAQAGIGIRPIHDFIQRRQHAAKTHGTEPAAKSAEGVAETQFAVICARAAADVAAFNLPEQFRAALQIFAAAKADAGFIFQPGRGVAFFRRQTVRGNGHLPIHFNIFGFCLRGNR